MRKGPIYSFFILAWFILSALVVSAQHFISVQSADKLPFALSINGVRFNSAKTGVLRVSNLSPGLYNLLINFAGDKYPSQNFSCILAKDDQSYILQNDPQTGWVLKDVKTGKQLAAVSGPDDESNTLEGRKGPGKPNGFASLLAQVADDSALLKPTVWVYTTKIDGSGPDETTADAPQAADDKGYVAATKGVIKALEEDVNGGTEMIFVDFNANGADTIHLMVPSTDVAANNAADSSSMARNSAITDTAQTATFGASPHTQQSAGTDSLTVNNTPPVKELAVAKADTLAFDTSSNKKFVNPFFNKNSPTAASSDTVAKSVDTTVAVPLPNRDTAATKVDTANAAYGSAQQQAAIVAPPINIATDNAPVPHDLSRTDCKKMLTDAAAEKLKHKIYLETDENKMIDIAHNYLDGRCITTQQVKDLASFFLSDDARLRFFKSMYPSVYDVGNFGSLESYMIDTSYKEQFRAILK